MTGSQLTSGVYKGLIHIKDKDFPFSLGVHHHILRNVEIRFFGTSSIEIIFDLNEKKLTVEKTTNWKRKLFCSSAKLFSENKCSFTLFTVCFMYSIVNVIL